MHGRWHHNYDDSIELPELIATASWFVWWQRRQQVRGEEVQTLLRSALVIHALALNFTRAAAKQTTAPRRNTWPIVLAAQQFLNVDASFIEDLHTGSCGAIVRDHRGNFIAATRRVFPHVPPVDPVEIKAIRYLIIAANIGFTKIAIESDNMNTLEAASDPDASMGGDAAIITEATILAMEFSNISFVRCCREANLVADCLAKHCFSTRTSEFWDSSPPDFILPNIVNDLAII